MGKVKVLHLRLIDKRESLLQLVVPSRMASFMNSYTDTVHTYAQYYVTRIPPPTTPSTYHRPGGSGRVSSKLKPGHGLADRCRISSQSATSVRRPALYAYAHGRLRLLRRTGGERTALVSCGLRCSFT